MSPSGKRTPSLIFWLEIFFWLVIGYFARAFYDRVTVSLTPVWLVWLLRLLLLALILGLAIFIHLQMERFLKSKGIIE